MKKTKKETEPPKRKGKCRRCGTSRNSEKYISCFNEYCDTDTLLDMAYF